MGDEARYGVEELATLGGVTRRTVRFYVQEGVLPAPFGLGRGARYGQEHLQRLLGVKSLQERGMSLDEVRRTLQGPEVDSRESVVPPMPRAVLTRIDLAPGVELLVDGRLRLPSPGKLAELSAWCRINFKKDGGRDEDV